MTQAVMPHKYAVNAPPATPPRYSLLGVATQIHDGARWQQGIEWSPEQQYGGGVIVANCLGDTPAGMNKGTNPALQFADPFVVYAEDHCSTLGWQARDYEGRARRQLEAIQSARAAAEFERGALAQSATPDLANNWLTKNPTRVGNPHSQNVIDALADLEMGLAAEYGGRQCMVHVTPAILTKLKAAYAIELRGQRYETPMGNVVVADAGYTGHGPDALASVQQWIYGTAMVQYRLSEVMLVPGTLDEARAFATDLSTNLTTIYAERLVLLQADPGVVAAETDLPLYFPPAS